MEATPKGKRKQAGRAQPQAAPAMPFTRADFPSKTADLQRQAIVQRQTTANPAYKDVDVQQRLAEISQPPTYPPATEQYKEGAKKVGEAFLKTPLGQQLTDDVKQLGKRFLATLEGKMIGGAVAAGAVTAIIAADEKLPVQAPAIPLDKLAPGLAVQISYEGPARHPIQAMLTFSYTPAAASPAAPKPPMTDAERFRAESARLARAQQQFRESLKSPAQRRAEEEERWQRFVQRHDPFNLFDLERIGVHLPANAGASPPGQGRLMRKATCPVSRLAPVVGGAPPLHRATRAEPLGGAARGLPLAPSGRQQAISGDQIVHFEQLLNRSRGLLKRELGPIEGGFWFMNGVELQFYVSDPALFQHYDFHPVQWAGPEVIWVNYSDPATPTWQEYLRSEGAGPDGPEPQNVAISRKQGIIAYYDSPGPDISKHLDKRPSRIHVVQNFTGWMVGRLRAGGAAQRLSPVVAWHSVVSLVDRNWPDKAQMPKWARPQDGANHSGMGWVDTSKPPRI